MAKLVSKTYGEALFETAMEAKSADGGAKAWELMEEICQLQEILKQNPDFDKLMKHPGIPKQEKLVVLKKTLKGRVSDKLLGFLEVVITKERYGELPAIFQYFIDKMKEEQKIGVVYVTTAVELDDAQKARIQEKLLKTTSYLKVEMHYSVDAALIGGMVIRINDRVVDSSIRTKISDLTKQLLQIQLG